MACTVTSIMTESHEAPVRATTSGLAVRREELRRRRHSSYHRRNWSMEDNVQVLVDRFLLELERRLDFIESYGQLRLDVGIERAYNTLHAVRDSCSSVRDDVLDAGKRRASVLVTTLETIHQDALARKETMEQKVHEGIRLLELTLADFEARAYAMRDAGVRAVAHDIYDEGHRRMHDAKVKAKEVMGEGLEKARRAKDSMKESVEHAVVHALARAKEHGLIKYEDLPEPWRVNPHILKGYRFHEDKLDCILSVFNISNESFNIWSHAIGLVIVLSIAFYFYPTSVNFSMSSKSDVFIAAMFFFAACKCLVCSTMWHTMSSISEQKLMERFACVDYTGISLLVAASIMTTEYTAFYCEPVSRYIYMGTTFLLGAGGVILPWHPTFNRADMAWARVCFYVSLSCTGLIPVFQLIYSRGLFWAIYFYAPIVKSLAVYFTGAVLYAAKIPERWCPGMFDYVGGSHNIWHVAVLGGILFHYMAMQEFFAQAFLRAQTQPQCSVY
ncbi:inc metabolism membrane protein [Diplodia intermedia]|uniref:Inc metabolism membrane protein n=1 Tax=Diplodia intermedia TaxID=856260 RepID=A0ABR3TSA6_9PEZI